MGPELLALLPNDVQKLVAICRLPLDRLSAFLRGLDCKKEGRRRVIDAVMSELGEGKKSKARQVKPDRVVAAFEQAATRTVAELKGATGEVGDEMRIRLRDALEGALAESQVTPAPASSRAADTPEAMLGS